VSRVAAQGDPKALAAEGASTRVRTQAAQDVKTSPEAIDAQARLARAKSLATLTTNEKDVSRKAQIALQAFPDIKRDLDSASDTLFSDRWKEFKTKTLGTEDSQKYSALRANVELMQTLVAQIHTGNRGVSKILDKFTDLFNVNKMTKQTFSDTMDAVKVWIERYAQLPNNRGGVDLGDVDKLVDSKATGKYGTIKVK
jgi:hypothetical protein